MEYALFSHVYAWAVENEYDGVYEWSCVCKEGSHVY